MGNYVNPNHPAGVLHSQESGFMRGTMNKEKTGSKHGSLAQRSYQAWVADQQQRSKAQTGEVTRNVA